MASIENLLPGFITSFFDTSLCEEVIGLAPRRYSRICLHRHATRPIACTRGGPLIYIPAP